MAKSPPAVDQLSYEQAYAELVKIVNTLENDQSTLDNAIELFERGQGLSKRCTELLDQAELKVRTLTGDVGLNSEEPQEA